MEREEVGGIAYVEKVLFLQHAEQVVEDIGDTHPNVPPKSLNSV